VRKRVWLKRTALVAGALAALLLFGVLPYALAGLVSFRKVRYQDRENAGVTPASFQVPFEDVAFRAQDGVELKGWWVPAAAGRGTVVLVHGLNRSRLEMVRKVPFVHEQGWNALLFDLRHHGDSGGSACSFGYFERRDVQAAVAYARERAPGAVVLWGVSLGAAASMLAAAEDPSIAGIVCDSSFRSLRDTARHHLGLLRSARWWLAALPAGLLADEAVFWMGRRVGFDPTAVDVEAAAARLSGRPALFVCNSGDRRMPPKIAEALRIAAGEQARLLVVPGDTHGGAYRNGTAAYQTAVIQVLEAARGAVPAGAAPVQFSRSRP